jgi:DNA polymerase/3'-5' exonuclease PolX
MSAGASMPWAEAYALAEHAAARLRPHVVRLKAVGSLRRRRERCNDLEFLAEPRMVEADLFGTMAPDLGGLRAALLELGTWVKGGERMMQITDFNGRAGLKLEIYLCHPPAQWGSLLAIRTGPYELGREAVTRMRERGVRHEDGRVVDQRGNVIPTPTEEAFFGLAGLPCLAPNQRDQFAGELEVARVRAQTARGAARHG